MKALIAPVALSLALAAGSSAEAAPLALHFVQVDPAGYAADPFTDDPISFTDSHHFTLGNTTVLSGQLSTFELLASGDPSPSGLPYLNITSAYFLSSLGQRIDLSQLQGPADADWSHGASGLELWGLAAPIELAAGAWDFFVTGDATSAKSTYGYAADFSGSSVPEPAAPLLAVAAFGAAGLARRRSRR